MEQIDFDYFKKMDLKVGEIKEVKEHPNADKLYIIKVDLGDEVREIVSGIREYYSVDELIGMKIVVITNLKPAVIRGIESKGMLLAAQHGESVILLTPEKNIENGSKIG